MESNELLKSLAKMEASLNEIESARKQVEKTIKASTDLQKVVNEYVSSVKTLGVSLQAWEADLRERETSLSNEFESAISQLNTTCTAITTAFHTDVVDIATEFKAQTESTLTQFVEQNQKLEGFVQKLNLLHDEIKKTIAELKPIKDMLTQLSTDLKESQREQDVVLDEIKQKVIEIPFTINGYALSINQKIDAMEQGLKAILNDLNTKIDLLNEKADNIKNVTVRILTAIQSSSETLTNAIISSKEETAKSIIINRWIIIAGIIILVALQFIV